LLHSIKHGTGGHWQLLVTPGVFQKDTDFLEYLLFQIIDTLLGGGKQKGTRPLEYVGDILVRRLLGVALRDLSATDKVELFPPLARPAASPRPAAPAPPRPPRVATNSRRTSRTTRPPPACRRRSRSPSRKSASRPRRRPTCSPITPSGPSHTTPPA